MLAIIGFGQHVIKTIIPALDRAKIKVKYIFIRDINIKHKHHLINFTTRINDILNDLSVTHVYIASPLSTHYYFTELLLKAGKNVLCEKPLSISVSDSNHLFQIAKDKDLYLNEVTMFSHHNQFKKLQTIINNHNFGKLLKINSCFQVPHLESNNIRYDKNQEGGALFDVGFYPIASILLLLPNAKLDSGKIFTQTGYDVDLIGTALLTDTDCFATASWGIGLTYKSYISLEYSECEIIVERAFSKPFNLNTDIKIKRLNGAVNIIKIDPDDHFHHQFTNFISKTNYESKCQKEVKYRTSVMETLKSTLRTIQK